MFLTGIGMGLLMPNSTLWIISITKPERRPLFVGLFHTSTYFGKFLSPIIATPIIAMSSLRQSYLFNAIMMLFVAILAMYLNDYFKRINRAIFRKEIRENNITQDANCAI